MPHADAPAPARPEEISTTPPKAGSIRLAVMQNFTAPTLKGFVAANTGDGSTIRTDGFSFYQGMEGGKQLLNTVGAVAAHVLPPSIHRISSDLKRLGLGVCHGCRRAHFRAYLDEFVFRWNR